VSLFVQKKTTQARVSLLKKNTSVVKTHHRSGANRQLCTCSQD